MKLRNLMDLNLEGKKVLLRLDLNVPLDGSTITDDTRIQAALPTIKYILEKTNKLVIMSHLGRPKGEPNPKFSLEPVGTRLAELLEREVLFIRDYLQEPVDQVLGQISKNQFVLLENVRFDKRETANDRDYAQALVSNFDFYVNDAFGAVHRAHASVVGCPNCFFQSRERPDSLSRKRQRFFPIFRKIQNPHLSRSSVEPRFQTRSA